MLEYEGLLGVRRGLLVLVLRMLMRVRVGMDEPARGVALNGGRLALLYELCGGDLLGLSLGLRLCLCLGLGLGGRADECTRVRLFPFRRVLFDES